MPVREDNICLDNPTCDNRTHSYCVRKKSDEVPPCTVVPLSQKQKTELGQALNGLRNKFARDLSIGNMNYVVSFLVAIITNNLLENHPSSTLIQSLLKWESDIYPFASKKNGTLVKWLQQDFLLPTSLPKWIGQDPPWSVKDQLEGYFDTGSMKRKQSDPWIYTKRLQRIKFKI